MAWNAGEDSCRLGGAPLEFQWQDVKSQCPLKCRRSTYVAELRKTGEELVPALSRTMKEAVGLSGGLPYRNRWVIQQEVVTQKMSETWEGREKLSNK